MATTMTNPKPKQIKKNSQSNKSRKYILFKILLTCIKDQGLMAQFVMKI